MDIILSLVSLTILSPIMLITATLVYYHLGWPVIFVQQRPGLRGKPFNLLKFRSMSDAKDERGNLLPPAERLSRFGKILRSTSLDELPELMNVLRGEMSLVGPRPLRMEYLERYTPEQMRRHDVKPGITGWAQVNGRNAIDWDTKFDLDLWYLDNHNLALDIRIIVSTIRMVLSRKGIAPEGEAVMTEFMGSEIGAREEGVL